MIAAVLLLVFLVAFPALVLWLSEKRLLLIHRISPVVICYAVGLLLGTTGIVPDSVFSLQETLSTVMVLLALPLLFFSLDIRAWARTGPRALLSFLLQTVSVTTVAVIGFLLFRGGSLGANAPVMAGMLVGVYTGGTINLAAIGTALGAPPELYVAANASDIVMTGLYLLVFMTVGKRVLRAILPRFRTDVGDTETVDPQSATSFGGILSGGVIGPLAVAVGLAVLIGGVAASLTLVVPGGWGTIAAILTVTTLAITASFVDRIRRIRYTFALGQYCILIFSLAVGSMADLAGLLSSALSVTGWVALAIFGSLILHTLLSALFRVDADTMMVTSVAAVCSPPFVPMIAASLGNRRVLGPGMITGIIGWVVGTYLGIGVALLLGGMG